MQNIALKSGLNKRINNVMQAAFYKLSGVLEENKAIDMLKNDVKNMYKSKGDKVIKMNINAIDMACNSLICIEPKKEWLNLPDEELSYVEKKRKNFKKVPG